MRVCTYVWMDEWMRVNINIYACASIAMLLHRVSTMAVGLPPREFLP